MRRLTFVFIALAFWTPALAERLPLRSYTTSDGLPSDTVNRIVQDPSGYLWFCTDEGLARFDGYAFTTFDLRSVTADPVVLDLLVSRDGAYWIATMGSGVIRFETDPPPGRLTALKLHDDPGSNMVRRLLEDADGTIWAGTHNGLYRLDKDAHGWTPRSVTLDPVPDFPETNQINDLLQDPDGSLWIASRYGGLYRRLRDGSIEHYLKHGENLSHIRTLELDTAGSLWVGTLRTIVKMSRPAGSGSWSVARIYTEKDGLPGELGIRDLAFTWDGTLYATTPGGLAEMPGASLAGEHRFRTYTHDHGLNIRWLLSLAEDLDGNLWIGEFGGGVQKLARQGFHSFGPEDGLVEASLPALVEDRRHHILGMGRAARGVPIHMLSPAGPPRTFHLDLPDSGWGWAQVLLQDRDDTWWVTTNEGVARFASNRATSLPEGPPLRKYTTRDGLFPGGGFRLFEDSRGDIWITTVDDHGVSLYERATGKLRRFAAQDGWCMKMASAIAEDRAGAIWMGGYAGDLTRYRDGRFECIGTKEGLPAGIITTLYRDARGSLWIGTDESGAARIDDPAAARPAFVRYTTADGLSSNHVSCIVEDLEGSIYIASGRGVDRMDPASGRMRHFDTDDGLRQSAISLCMRDSRGDLWFATAQSVVRMTPREDRSSPPPPVRITGLTIAGERYPVSLLGQVSLSGLTLSPDQRQLEVEFVGLGFAPGRKLMYQYRLGGAGAPWSPPAERRAVTFAGLSHGSYLLQVQARDSGGQVSPTPATLAFTVLPPIWLRWWFLTGAGLLGLGLAVTAHRMRLARLLELERVRTRIATDLHDDIGSSLSQISILSEVARRRADGGEPGVDASLEKISSVSGDLVEAMSDIVWSVNPRRDRLSDLSQRMRWFASDLLEGQGIAFTFSAPGADQDLRLDADVRRQVFLVFKEAVHNAARHSGCSRVEIDLERAGDGLVMTVADDGRGFNSGAHGSGHGLSSMKARAASLGGRLEIETRPGGGTRIRLRSALKPRRQLRLSG